MNPTTAPDKIIGKGNMDASLFLIMRFYKLNYLLSRIKYKSINDCISLKLFLNC